MFIKNDFVEGVGPGLSATLLNANDDAIFSSFWQAPFLENSEVEFTRTGDKLTLVEESVATVLRRRTDLTYTGDQLTSVRVRSYADDGVTVISDYTDTATYSGPVLTKVTRVVTV